MYKYLFGPVPSRRLGMSLGVDLVPHKVCSLNCVYCECGPTTKPTLDRMEYVPYEKVREELEDYFKNNKDPDYITFSGAGEPTLNKRIGDVLKFIKSKKPDIPVAVLTNGTLFRFEEVRKELMEADLVLPSLDAATDLAFQRINRPDDCLDINTYLRGLEDFRKEFRGDIWLEVFILPGFNDDKRNLNLLREAILRIKPNRVQLNTLDRPGTIENLSPASENHLKQIAADWSLNNVEIIAKPAKRKDIKSYREDKESAILETIVRRPCTAEDLAQILGLHLNEVNKYLDVLEHEKKISGQRQERGIFYKGIQAQ
ncbi:MAG: radical SAM protein [Bacteroidales bacterium]|nr:radical SAM protein [Bacteroidales bacterium]MCF8344288.1 radical SAM protein [Bacteroidales bacterium]MCF8351900.1 radical SAM protein [Bacteroidales bacterium]MCF8377328.1 radical SAM protein [Bacteroidales bacterium]